MNAGPQQTLYPMLDLSGLSDEALFSLREVRDAGPLQAVQHDLREVDAFAETLGPRDLFSFARVTLLRSYRFEAKGRDDKAMRLLREFLAHYEPYYPKLNMLAYLPMAVALYARLGDLLLEKAERPDEACDVYLRILALGSLRRTMPFTMMVAASRIVRGATIRFLETGDQKQVRHALYGTGLFRFAIQAAYDSTAADYAVHAVGQDRFELPKPHFFREIAREAQVIADAMAELNARLAGGTPGPQGA